MRTAKRYTDISSLPDPTPCPKCKGERIRSTNGQIRCKPCNLDRFQKYLEKNREKCLNYWKTRYLDNKEDILKKQKERYRNNKETIAVTTKKWRLKQLPEYHVWAGMIARCTITSNGSYPRYGGRKENPITVCDHWLHSFKNFYSDMGARPSPKHSIDRKDVNGNYEPSNCRWATVKEQANNRTTTLRNRLGISDESPLIYKEKIITIKHFSVIEKIPLDIVKYRYSQHAIADWIIHDDYDNRYYLYKNHKYNMVEISLIAGVSYSTTYVRINTYKWSVEKAAETPVQ